MTYAKPENTKGLASKLLRSLAGPSTFSANSSLALGFEFGAEIRHSFSRPRLPLVRINFTLHSHPVRLRTTALLSPQGWPSARSHPSRVGLAASASLPYLAPLPLVLLQPPLQGWLAHLWHRSRSASLAQRRRLPLLGRWRPSRALASSALPRPAQPNPHSVPSAQQLRVLPLQQALGLARRRPGSGRLRNRRRS